MHICRTLCVYVGLYAYMQDSVYMQEYMYNYPLHAAYLASDPSSHSVKPSVGTFGFVAWFRVKGCPRRDTSKPLQDCSVTALPPPLSMETHGPEQRTSSCHCAIFTANLHNYTECHMCSVMPFLCLKNISRMSDRLHSTTALSYNCISLPPKEGNTLSISEDRS